MVRIQATQIIDMQRYTGMIDQPLEKLAHQIDFKLSDQRAGKLNLKLQPRPPGKIDHHP